MNSPIKMAGFAVGATALFFFAFVTFSAFSGAPMHKVAMIGRFFEPPADPEENPELAKLKAPVDPADDKTKGELIEASASIAGSFVLPSPFSSNELQALQSELKAKKTDYEQRLQKIRERERTLQERESLVEERYSELEVLRTALQEFESELSLRSEEVTRDESARALREKASWTAVAGLFEKGDAEDLVTKLLTYSPDEAAKIFTSLSVERVRSLTEALPVDRYQDYVRAWRAMQTDQAPKK